MAQISFFQPPPYGTPLTDQKGFITPAWQKFFQQLYQRSGAQLALPNTPLTDVSVSLVDRFLTGPSIIYTSPTGVTTVLDSFTLTNVDSSSHTISIWLVPFGAVASSQNQLVTNLAIAAAKPTNITTLVSQVVGSGGTIVCTSDAPSVMRVSITGRQVS